MEPEQTSAPKKVYMPGWIGFATYVGGLFAGCYLLSKNDAVLGEENRSASLFSLGIIGTIAVGFLLGFMSTEWVSKIPDSLIPLTYTLAMYMYVEKTQRESILTGIESGQLVKASGWRAFGIGLLCLIFTIVLLFLGLIAGAMLSGQW